MIRPSLFAAFFLLFSAAPALAQDSSYWDSGFDTGGGSGGGSRGSLFGGSDFSYGYFDLGYFNHDFQSDAVDTAGGFGGVLSVPLVDSLYVKAALGFASPADQTTGQDLDYVTWQLGAGIGLPIATGFDLVLEAGIAHQELTGARFLDSFDGYGYYASPGVRWAIGDLIELNGGVTFMNIDSDSNVSVDLKALLHLLPSVSLWGGASFSEEVNQYGVGLRLSF